MGLKVLDPQSLDHTGVLYKPSNQVVFIFEVAFLAKDTILGIHIEVIDKLVEGVVDTKDEVKESSHTDKFAIVVVLKHRALSTMVILVNMAFVTEVVFRNKAFVAVMVLVHRELAGRITKFQAMEAAQISVEELVLPL